MKLTRNERRALKLLIENSRVSDAEIARVLKVTPQAVGRMRKKLESDGIITGYNTQIDYEKMGIKVMAIVLFKFTPEARKTVLTEEDINRRIQGPHIVQFFRVPEGDVTHIVIYGFRSLEELDNYFHILQTERGHISEIKEMFIFSSKSMRKSSDSELFLKVLGEMGAGEVLARPLSAKGEDKKIGMKRKGFTDMDFGRGQ